jgi:pseudomonalisin/xanthomonalisin
LVSVLVCALAVTSAAALPGASARAAGVRWTGDVLPAGLLTDRIGRPDPSQQIRVDVALSDPNLTAERALADAVVDPGDPSYHHFPSAAQYAARFALPASRRQAALAWLRGGGLSVRQASGLGDLWQATGTVAAIERTFDVHLGRYRSGPEQFLANDVAPQVPGGLGVAGVIGLNDLQRFAPTGTEAVAHSVTPRLGVFSGMVDLKTLWRTYDAPTGDEGQGVSAGVFMSGNSEPVIGSLRVFEDTEHLPKVPVRTVYTEPGKPDEFKNNDGAGEWMLDTDASTGMAPRLSQLSLYTAKSLMDADVIAEFAYWAADPTGPQLMNASFGTCEALPVFDETSRGGVAVMLGNDIQDAAEKSLMQAFTEGRTLFVAAGDTGSSCPMVSLPAVGAGNGVANQVVPAQDYPAASRWTTAVGGTVLSLAKDGARTDEQVWAFGGGGSALFIPEPDWQKSESHIDRPCLGTDADGVALPPGTICRGVPDIAALSGNTTQALFITAYDQPSSVGGTSLSSPLTMGMWARVVAAAREPLGPAAPAIYRLKADARADDFFDVTTGELGGNGLYLPGAGWDYTTGYGVPDIARLAMDLTGRTTAVSRRPASAVPDARTGDAVACLPFGTSPVGNVDTSDLGDNAATRDITSAAMTLSPDGRSLVITVGGPKLSKQVPLGSSATTVQVVWIHDGVTYLAQSSADPFGNVTGTVMTPERTAGPFSSAFPHPQNQSPAPRMPKPNPTFNPVYSPGLLTMTIPFSAIGSPHVGDRLRYPTALSGTDGDAGDVAGPAYDYTVGQRCRS